MKGSRTTPLILLASLVLLVAGALSMGPLSSTPAVAQPPVLTRTPVATVTPCMVPLDYYLVIDGSSSVRDAGAWNFLKTAAINFITGVGTTENPPVIRGGANQFSSQPAVRSIVANLTGNASTLITAINAEPIIANATDTEAGLQDALDKMRAQARPGVRQAVILITDGEQNQPGDPFAVADAIRASGMMFKILAGGTTSPARERFLRQLTGANPDDLTDPRLVDLYWVINLEDMIEAIKGIAQDVCNPPDDGGTRTPTPTSTSTSGTATPCPTLTTNPGVCDPNGGGGTPTPTPCPTVATTGRCTPTAITLSELSTVRLSSTSGKVVWSTGMELNTAGFSIYRTDRAEGEAVQINEQLIIARGNASTGASYEFTDNNLTEAAAYYWLVEEEIGGKRTWYGPVRLKGMNEQEVFVPFICKECIIP